MRNSKLRGLQMLYFGNVYKFCSRLIFPAENSLAFFFGAAGGAFPKSRLLAAWYIIEDAQLKLHFPPYCRQKKLG